MPSLEHISLFVGFSRTPYGVVWTNNSKHTAYPCRYVGGRSNEWHRQTRAVEHSGLLLLVWSVAGGLMARLLGQRRWHCGHCHRQSSQCSRVHLHAWMRFTRGAHPYVTTDLKTNILKSSACRLHAPTTISTIMVSTESKVHCGSAVRFGRYSADYFRTAHHLGCAASRGCPCAPPNNLSNPSWCWTISSVQSHLFLNPIGAQTLKLPIFYSPPNLWAYTRTPSHNPGHAARQL